MEILTSKAEVREKLKNNPLQAAHLLRLNGYGSIKYACACGDCLLYTSPSPRDPNRSRMPSSA